MKNCKIIFFLIFIYSPINIFPIDYNYEFLDQRIHVCKNLLDKNLIGKIKSIEKKEIKNNKEIKIVFQEYDETGNILFDKNYEFHYDDKNRLKNITSNGFTEEISFNDKNHIIKKGDYFSENYSYIYGKEDQIINLNILKKYEKEPFIVESLDCFNNFWNSKGNLIFENYFVIFFANISEPLNSIGNVYLRKYFDINNKLYKTVYSIFFSCIKSYYEIETKYYNENGNIVKTEFNSNSNGIQNNQTEYEITYNDLNKIVIKKEIIKTNQKEIKVCFYNYFYDSNNKLIKETKLENDKIIETIEYKYDFMGNITSIKEFNFDNKGNSTIKKEEITNYIYY